MLLAVYMPLARFWNPNLLNPFTHSRTAHESIFGQAIYLYTNRDTHTHTHTHAHKLFWLVLVGVQTFIMAGVMVKGIFRGKSMHCQKFSKLHVINNMQQSISQVLESDSIKMSEN